MLAHPCHDSYTHACAAAAVRGLTPRRAHRRHDRSLRRRLPGSDVTLMSGVAYESEQPDPRPDGRRSRVAAAARRRDRLRLPDVVERPAGDAEGLAGEDDGAGSRRSCSTMGSARSARGCSHVRRIVGISSYGSSPDRTSSSSTTTAAASSRARCACPAAGARATTWLALYAIDTADDRPAAAASSNESSRRLAAL